MISCTSIFSQILFVMKTANVSFDAIVARQSNDIGDQERQGLHFMQQLVAMLFSNLARNDSLREITKGLECCAGETRYLGAGSALRRPALDYASGHRGYGAHEEYFRWLMGSFSATKMIGRTKWKCRFKNKPYSMDSTTISLCHSLFPWAKYRREKGGVKVHVLLDHADYMPAFVHITDARTGDCMVAPKAPLRKDSIVAVDRGYVDFAQFRAWDAAGVFFARRMKDNIRHSIAVPCRNGLPCGIASDDEILLDRGGDEREIPEKAEARHRVEQGNVLYGQCNLVVTGGLFWQFELFWTAVIPNTHLAIVHYLCYKKTILSGNWKEAKHAEPG